MKILIFGGTGFIGFHIVKNIYLTYPQAEVLVFHRTSSNLTFLKELNKPIKYIITDFSEADLDKINSADVIINCLGDTNLSPLYHQRQVDINITLAVAIAKVALRLKAKLIHTSSQAAFGFSEDIIDESFESKALQSGIKYAETKFLGEMKIKEMVKKQSLKAVFLNPAITIGSHDSHNWAKLILKIKAGKIPGIPNSEGSYCSADEVGRAHVMAIEKGRVGENYILGGPNHTFKVVFEMIINLLEIKQRLFIIPVFMFRFLGLVNDIKTRITGKEQEFSYEETLLVTNRLCVSSEKAVAELGYDDKVPLEKILKESVEWTEAQN